MLFIDFSSAFNTITPQQLTEKLNTLGFNTPLCNWILDCVTGKRTSRSITLNTGSLQGRVLPPFTLLTHDCSAKSPPSIMATSYRGTIEST